MDWHLHHLPFAYLMPGVLLSFHRAHSPPSTSEINVPHEKATYFSSLFPLIFNRIKFRYVSLFLKASPPGCCVEILSSRACLCFQGLMSMSLFSYELCFTRAAFSGGLDASGKLIEKILTCEKAISDRHLAIFPRTFRVKVSERFQINSKCCLREHHEAFKSVTLNPLSHVEMF